MKHIHYRLATGVALLAALAPQAAAQQTRDSSQASNKAVRSREKPWRISGSSLDLTSGYVDNVFLLKARRTDNLDSPSATDLTSGRYDAMLSPSDLITTIQGETTLRGPGLGGRTLSLTPELNYEYYAKNARRRNAAIGLVVEQSLPNGRDLRFKARIAPSYFGKNYLADAVDTDGNGSIEPVERRYRAGVYSETELAMDYRHRLARSSRRHPLGAALRVGGGFYARTYEAPFSGRDLSGPTGRMQLQLSHRNGLDFDVGYELASLGATPTAEVLLLDETEVGRDLNGNGSMNDVAVRSVQTVDRSLTEHRLGAALTMASNQRATFRAEYEYRLRGYASDEPMDVAYNGRNTGRHALAAEVSFVVSRNVRLGVGGAIASQSLSREGDFGATGEIQDYTKRGVTMRLGYRF